MPGFFSIFRRKPTAQTMQVDLAFVTDLELIHELRSRSRAFVCVRCLLSEKSWRLSYGGTGDAGDGPQAAELLGLCNIAAVSLMKEMGVKK